MLQVSSFQLSRGHLDMTFHRQDLKYHFTKPGFVQPKLQNSVDEAKTYLIDLGQGKNIIKNKQQKSKIDALLNDFSKSQTKELDTTKFSLDSNKVLLDKLSKEKVDNVQLKEKVTEAVVEALPVPTPVEVNPIEKFDLDKTENGLKRNDLKGFSVKSCRHGILEEVEWKVFENSQGHQQLSMIMNFQNHVSEIELTKQNISKIYEVQEVAKQLTLNKGTTVLDPRNPEDILFLGRDRWLQLLAHGFKPAPRNQIDVSLVVEASAYPVLENLLINRKGVDPWPNDDETALALKTEWTLTRSLSWLRDIAQGLAFFHAKDTHFHGRFSSDSICFTEGMEVKLFALHNPADSATQHTMAFVPHEVRIGEELGIQSDIFSFGVAIIAMITRATPSSKNLPKSMSECIKKHFKENLDCDSELLKHVEQLFLSCLATNPKDRPTAMKLAVELDELVQVISSIQPSTGVSQLESIVSELKGKTSRARTDAFNAFPNFHQLEGLLPNKDKLKLSMGVPVRSLGVCKSAYQVFHKIRAVQEKVQAYSPGMFEIHYDRNHNMTSLMKCMDLKDGSFSFSMSFAKSIVKTSEDNEECEVFVVMKFESGQFDRFVALVNHVSPQPVTIAPFPTVALPAFIFPSAQQRLEDFYRDLTNAKTIALESKFPPSRLNGFIKLSQMIYNSIELAEKAEKDLFEGKEVTDSYHEAMITFLHSDRVKILLAETISRGLKQEGVNGLLVENVEYLILFIKASLPILLQDRSSKSIETFHELFSELITICNTQLCGQIAKDEQSNNEEVRGINALAIPALYHLSHILLHLLNYGTETIVIDQYITFRKSLKRYIAQGRGGIAAKQQLTRIIEEMKMKIDEEKAIRTFSDGIITLQDTIVEPNELLPALSMLTLASPLPTDSTASAVNGKELTVDKAGHITADSNDDVMTNNGTIGLKDFTELKEKVEKLLYQQSLYHVYSTSSIHSEWKGQSITAKSYSTVMIRLLREEVSVRRYRVKLVIESVKGEGTLIPQLLVFLQSRLPGSITAITTASDTTTNSTITTSLPNDVKDVKSMIITNVQHLRNRLTSTKSRDELITDITYLRVLTDIVETMNSSSEYHDLCRNQVTVELCDALSIALTSRLSTSLTADKDAMVYFDDYTLYGLILLKHYVNRLISDQVDDYLFTFSAIVIALTKRTTTPGSIAVSDNDSLMLKLLTELFIAFTSRCINIADKSCSPLAMYSHILSTGFMETSEYVEYTNKWWKCQIDIYENIKKMIQPFSSRPNGSWARNLLEQLLDGQKRIRDLLKNNFPSVLEEDDKNACDEMTSNKCIVCLDKVRDRLCVPCLHVCFCKDCVEEYGETLTDSPCPRCRAPVTEIKQYFF